MRGAVTLSDAGGFRPAEAAAVGCDSGDAALPSVNRVAGGSPPGARH